MTAAVAAVATPGGAGAGCLQQLRWVQFVLGYALPTFVLYCIEARSRARWQWQCWQAAKQAQLCTATGQQQQRNSSSSPGGSISSSDLGAAAEAEGPAACDTICLMCGLPNQAAAAAENVSGSSALQQQQAYDALGDDSGKHSNSLLHNQLQQQQQEHMQPADAPATKTGQQLDRCSNGLASLLRQQQQQNRTQGMCSCAVAACCPDTFCVESQQAHLPPTAREVYLLLLSLGLVWLGLRALG
jgi:hypothetical protein